MLLAIDTASRVLSLALHDGNQVWFEATWHSPNNHTVELTPAIHNALRRLRLTPATLSAVAVSRGPGSFTGLRIGIGVAKGLAMAQNLAFVAVPTLEIIAAGVPAYDGALVSVLQAGRGRVCAQRFHYDMDAWKPAGQPEITTWQKLLAAVEPDTLFAGEITPDGRAVLTTSEHPVQIAAGTHSLRRAGMLAEIAWKRLKANATDDPASITPIYLHQPGVANS